MPKDFSYVIDELLHVQKDEDDNQVRYHEEILNTIIQIDSADEFIIALAALIKRLAVDHLHIVGDIYDRGPYADKIMDLLINYHSLDIQWGNHDILWMGAVAGNKACIANVIRNNIRYNNMMILESGYGISLRNLALFAEKTYKNNEAMDAAFKAISVILFKLEGQIIKRHSEYQMDDRLLLHKMDLEKGIIEIEGKKYDLNDTDFPTLNEENPYELSVEEIEIMEELKAAFSNSKRLRDHIEFLYKKGNMYLKYNNNLLYHGCVPLDESGNFEGVETSGKIYKVEITLTLLKRWLEELILVAEAKLIWILCGIYGVAKSHRYLVVLSKLLNVLLYQMNHLGKKIKIHIMIIMRWRRLVI